MGGDELPYQLVHRVWQWRNHLERDPANLLVAGHCRQTARMPPGGTIATGGVGEYCRAHANHVVLHTLR